MSPLRTIAEEPNGAQIFLAGKVAQSRIVLNANETIVRLTQAILPKITQSCTTQVFFLKLVSDPNSNSVSVM
jgi:hypothetical protein